MEVVPIHHVKDLFSRSAEEEEETEAALITIGEQREAGSVDQFTETFGRAANLVWREKATAAARPQRDLHPRLFN